MKPIYYILIGLFAINTASCNNSQARNNENNNHKNEVNMKFEKVALPYATDALEPVISKQTIELHYGKHHQAYVDNLNKLTVGTKFEKSDLETVVKESDGAIFNNAGQVLNHNLYFTSFKKKMVAESPKVNWLMLSVNNSVHLINSRKSSMPPGGLPCSVQDGCGWQKTGAVNFL